MWKTEFRWTLLDRVTADTAVVQTADVAGTSVLPSAFLWASHL